MTVTAVPLRPLKKGALAKLWIGLAVLVLGAVALAWLGTEGLHFRTTESGLQYRVIEEGEGPSPTAEDIALIHYTGRLEDGTVFDTTEGRQPVPLPAGPGGSIPGFAEALQMMRKGAVWEIQIPPDLAYGERGVPGVIPPDSTLEFRVELVDFVPQAALQGMMPMAPGGAPGQ